MDVKTIHNMNCDMFEYWCYKIHRIALTLYTLASIQSKCMYKIIEVVFKIFPNPLIHTNPYTVR